MSNDNQVYTVSRKNDRKILTHGEVEKYIDYARKIITEYDDDIIHIYDAANLLKIVIKGKGKNIATDSQISNSIRMSESLEFMKKYALSIIDVDKIFDDAIVEIENSEKDNRRLCTHTERTIGIILNFRNISEKQLCRGRNILFMAYVNMAHAYGNSMWLKRSAIYNNFELEDFNQAGMEGLWVAIRKYDGRNRLSSYAVWWIRHYIQRIAPNDVPKNIIERKEFNDERLLSLTSPSQLPEFDSDNDFAQYVEQSSYTYSTSTISSKSVEDQIEEDDMDQRISACIHDMPKIEQAIAKNIANDGTMKYILDKFNITSRQYKLTYARALSDLRKAVGEE